MGAAQFGDRSVELGNLFARLGRSVDAVQKLWMRALRALKQDLEQQS